MIGKVFFNRAPLTPNRFAELPLGAIMPEGWLKEQMNAAADGLTGTLYKFWDDVKNSAWKGGDGDAWERGPYYMDGLLPMAYLTGWEELMDEALQFVEWTLASQKEDGSFGPESNSDWWPRMVMLKVLIQYYTATGDRRVPEMMLKYFAYQYRNLDQHHLQDWAVSRGAYILCAYSASNGGYTVSNASVWGSSPLAYFPVKKDPYDLENPSSVVKSYRVPRNPTAGDPIGAALRSPLRSALSLESGEEITKILSMEPHTEKYGVNTGTYRYIRFTVQVEKDGQTRTESCDLATYDRLESLLGLNITTSALETVCVEEGSDCFYIRFRRISVSASRAMADLNWPFFFSGWGS